MLFAATLGFGAPAVAQGPDTLRENLLRKHGDGRSFTAPPVARYVSEDGDIFVLDRSQPKPLLKFDGSPEVWALQQQPAPRGDTIYKNDLGQPMLRATRLGGVTLFTPGRPGGSAAALAGAGPTLKLGVMGPQALAERLLQASIRASRAARRGITFEAEATPASSALIADAAIVTSVAVVRMAERRDSRALLGRFQKVLLVEGRRAAAIIDKGVMRITVAPAQGQAGRPSSDRIVAVAVAAGSR